MKRKHPLRRIMIGVAATASGVVLLLALKQPGGTPVAGAAAQTGTGVSAATGGTGAAGQSLLGEAVDTQYGPVQVRITLTGGKITLAEAVQAPKSDARSQSITADAVPKLNQAAVTAQSARIDAVSGASYTSKGYQDSLQSALDQAGSGDAATGTTTGGSGAGSVEAGGAPENVATPAPDPSTTPSTGDSGTGTGTGTGTGAGSAATGTRTVLGSAVDTQYGPVQVRITVSGGRVTQAEAVRAPSSDARSQSITANSVPQLNQAAVTAQSARIDAVSGASYTSKGYQGSLQSALDQAGI
ncbi:FMN-binding protein [Streptomyces sp. NPDC088554]|uniref:FMN-binding protein n=1 Tax=Streptomyces sp. NPDC088554 TaxID=3365865 RepID=UPI0037F7A303